MARNDLDLDRIRASRRQLEDLPAVTGDPGDRYATEASKLEDSAYDEVLRAVSAHWAPLTWDSLGRAHQEVLTLLVLNGAIQFRLRYQFHAAGTPRRFAAVYEVTGDYPRRLAETALLAARTALDEAAMPVGEPVPVEARLTTGGAGFLRRWKSSAEFVIDYRYIPPAPASVRMIGSEIVGVAESSRDVPGSESITGSADSADTSKLFFGDIPDNPDIRDLVCKLDAARGSKKSWNAIARELTGEKKDADPKAQSLLRQIRRLRKAGKVTL